MNRDFVSSIESEFRRYEALGEATIRQLDSGQVGATSISTNSVATLVWHVSGNLMSRFTDFLTTDGEKPWRDRESEFAARQVAPEELLTRWEKGWAVLFDTLASLSDADLARSVTIRSIPLTVREALHRSLAHASYHVGQIVLIGRSLRGAEWTCLSIPPGGSGAYNESPSFEKPADQARRVRRESQ